MVSLLHWNSFAFSINIKFWFCWRTSLAASVRHVQKTFTNLFWSSTDAPQLSWHQIFCQWSAWSSVLCFWSRFFGTLLSSPSKVHRAGQMPWRERLSRLYSPCKPASSAACKRQCGSGVTSSGVRFCNTSPAIVLVTISPQVDKLFGSASPKLSNAIL